MEDIREKTVGAVVAADYRTAEVFRKYKIDFCCNGHTLLQEACAKKNIDPDQLMEDIEAVLATPSSGDGAVSGYNFWPLDLLADYIEKTHHRFVTAQIPVLEGYLDKLCRVHGKQHPELHEISALFRDSAGAMTMHMKKEELMLFPFIRRMVLAGQGHEKPQAPFGTVQSPIRTMEHEHDAEGERFRAIRGLSHDYAVPEDGCNTYRVTYAMLQAYETDLHLHVHLENNILFPKAIALEQRLAAGGQN